MKKNPWVAAIINFFIPGLGYLYSGTKRTWFAVLLLLGSVISLYWMFTNQDVYRLATGFWANVITIAWGLAFAVDAYNEVKKNKK